MKALLIEKVLEDGSPHRFRAIVIDVNEDGVKSVEAIAEDAEIAALSDLDAALTDLGIALELQERRNRS